MRPQFEKSLEGRIQLRFTVERDLGTDKGERRPGMKNEELVRNQRRPERSNQAQPLKLMQGKIKT